MEKLSKGGFQAFLKKKADPEKEAPEMEMEDQLCPKCKEPMTCPRCLEVEEENEKPGDEEVESPSYQRGEKKFGMEKR